MARRGGLAAVLVVQRNKAPGGLPPWGRRVPQSGTTGLCRMDRRVWGPEVWGEWRGA
jgi:hypothetical protein